MSPADNGVPSESVSTSTPGVLSQLPRARPQRASARRIAARETPAKAPATATRPKRKPSKSAPSRATAPSGTATKRKVPLAAAATPVEPAPRQGFECEPERMNRAVHPPGGAELVASAAEIVGELARAGLSAGERALKDVLSRLPRS